MPMLRHACHKKARAVKMYDAVRLNLLE
jgi:hypothetical protein